MLFRSQKSEVRNEFAEASRDDEEMKALAMLFLAGPMMSKAVTRSLPSTGT